MLFILIFTGIIFRDIRRVFCVHFISVVGNCGVCKDDPNNLSWHCLLSFNITVLWLYVRYNYVPNTSFKCTNSGSSLCVFTENSV